MGFFARLLGTEAPTAGVRPGARMSPPPSADAQAIERYRYMVQSAPPETLEKAHEEAFEKLTPEQRRQVLSGLVSAAPAHEQAAVAATPPDDTRALARAATRAEVRDPGVMERTLGGAGMGLGASLLSSFAMGFVGSMVANSFFSALGGFGDHGGSEAAAHDEPAADDTGNEGDTYAGYEDDGGFDGGGDFEV
jgi:hypothetical protein